MMLEYIALMVLMTLLALAFVLLPLLLDLKRHKSSAAQLNIKLYQQKITALDQQLATGELTEAAYKLSKTNLAKHLLADAALSEKDNPFKPATITAIVLMLLLPLLAFMTYRDKGDGQQLLHYWKLQRQTKIARMQLAQMKNPQTAIKKLEVFLKQKPNHSKGWYLLGRIYMGEHYYQKAFYALRKAYQLNTAQPSYAVAYAEAAFFYRHRHLSLKMQYLLHRVLVKEPHNTAALNLLAVNAYVHQRYDVAIRYWERMLPLFAPGSRDSRVLLSMIAQAQRQQQAAKH